MTEPIHIISLGAGVQSSTMALMAAKGEITPMPTAAIFADTRAEPNSVYKWLDYLEKQLPFPVYTVSAGDLWQSELRVIRSKKSNRLYLKNSIPAFVLKEDGSRGLLGRKCTSDFKIIPLQRKVRELVGIKRAGRGIIYCKMWIGISIDEAHRMKPSRVDYIENVWPLIDKGFSREQCLVWMKENGFPEPPRSACVFCPFHSDYEWKRMQEYEPNEFSNAVRFELELQEAADKQEQLKGKPFLHESCVSLKEIQFNPLSWYEEIKSGQKSRPRQLSLFGNECEGMCGV